MAGSMRAAMCAGPNRRQLGLEGAGSGRAVASDLPYMPSSGNVSAVLDKIRGAGTPPKFTREFLTSTLGFTASQDRSFPRILKQLGFLSADGTPLPRYNDFKSSTTGGKALAAGLREGWAPLFLADQKAHDRSSSELTEIFKTVTGQSDAVAKKMAATFKAFANKADWTGGSTTEALIQPAQERAQESTNSEIEQQLTSKISLHHDVHIHLPPTSDVSIYRAIFRAMRDELL
jgi:hypothetical protein